MDNNTIDIYENTIDILIKFAGSKAIDKLFDDIENSINDEDIEFSDKHIEAINNIILNEKNNIKKVHKYKTNRRILLVALIAILTLLISALSVSAFREKIIEFFTEITKLDTIFHYESENEEELDIDSDVNIKYIPKGFEQVQEYQNRNECYSYYTNEGQFFDISKQIIFDTHALNTENGTIKHIDINGVEAFFSSSDKIKIISWIKNGYLYTVSGNIDEDTIINIAKNIFWKNFKKNCRKNPLSIVLIYRN